MQTILSYGMGVESTAIMWNKKSKPGNQQFEVNHRLRPVLRLIRSGESDAEPGKH